MSPPSGEGKLWEEGVPVPALQAECCGSLWGYVRVTQSQGREMASGLGAETELGSHEDAAEARAGTGWEDPQGWG